MRHEHLLEEIGNRTRALRKKYGLTLKEIAGRSGLSPRFFSDLEAGRGNISVARLADVAGALDVPIAKLVPPELGNHSPLERVLCLLDRCSDEDLEALLRWLGPRLQIEKQPVIALVGLRGAGKSTIGAALARRLRIPFIELDALIETQANLSLGELFSLHGESYYKRLAHEIVVRLLARQEPAVVATGGSVVTDPETWGLLKQQSHTVWLKATPEDHWKRVLSQGDTRPMANRSSAMAELRSILAIRSEVYAEASQSVDTSTVSVEEAVHAISNAVRNTPPRAAKARGKTRSTHAD